MQLILVRHAIACVRDARRWPDDALRPLTPAGRRKFRDAVKAIRRVLPTVEVLLSSGLVRADETARILTDEARWPQAEPLEALRPGRSPEAVLEAVRRRLAGAGRTSKVAARGAGSAPRKSAGSVALVGHEPQIAGLLSAALARDTAIGCDFRKGAIAVIEFDGPPEPGRGRLLWFAPPSVVRALRRKRRKRRP